MVENRGLFSDLFFFLKTVGPILVRAVFGWGSEETEREDLVHQLLPSAIKNYQESP